ncbi:alpha/beta fold hydrolase [Actinomyces minihominis]|uniref:alpha/beta fold hydrolase n=1 Tax=Actinomyces minihominis TaxID=2002838 RepID=UPI000C070D60|nr:alpha/beta hydrolase [Actinomyces minihominis]
MFRLDTPSSPLAFYAASSKNEQQIRRRVPLVLGHALGSSAEMWQWVLPLLPERLPVILWEQPGHGESELLNRGRATAKDTALAVNRGLRDLGVLNAHVAGISLGGMVSLAYASAYPLETASLSVLDSGPVITPASAWKEKADQVERDGVAPLVDGTMERWFTGRFAAGPGVREVQEIRQIFLSTDRAGYAQCCRIIAHTDLTDQLAMVSSPSMVLTGEDDAGNPPAAARHLAVELSAPHTVVIVPDARHLTAVEQPEVVAAALIQHLAQAEKMRGIR